MSITTKTYINGMQSNRKAGQSNLFFNIVVIVCVIHQLAELLVKHNMHRACANRPLYAHCTSCCIHNNRHVHVNYL